ncbi:hypothetical protein PHJA_002046300 [Phtheirospermum japonicum]|uniref:Uncharacterized protein n=1 Tax=Phtheirospermum japonicum TaxID=374723 RepID=A0A830CSC0_9LAMI|nr:hypothetical protein PHJA_002046300 [Phtheirospermum japonicum]
MPQVDLETLPSVCTGNGQKIALETKYDVIPGEHAAGDDLPPESFWLSKDAEYDWFDRNAVYERNESTKGNSNTNNMNPIMNNSNSQRSSALSKASIIGLPKTQKNTFLDSKWRPCKASNTRLFPKREKSTVQEAEPGSPKVSCMGRVRSKRGRRRSNSLKTKENPAEKLSDGDEKPKSGICSRVLSVFRSKKGHKKPARSGSGKVVEEPVMVEPPRKSVGLKARPARGEPAIDPPGLGGLNRFASGRRSCEWAAEEINQAI